MKQLLIAHIIIWLIRIRLNVEKKSFRKLIVSLCCCEDLILFTWVSTSTVDISHSRYRFQCFGNMVPKSWINRDKYQSIIQSDSSDKHFCSLSVNQYLSGMNNLNRLNYGFFFHIVKLVLSFNEVSWFTAIIVHNKFTFFLRIMRLRVKTNSIANNSHSRTKKPMEYIWLIKI